MSKYTVCGYDMELLHKTVDHVAELAERHDIKVHYAVKANVKHLAVLPPGKQKFVRLRRLGEEYTEELLWEADKAHQSSYNKAD